MTLLNYFILLILSAALLNCGVRGDPIPPGAPAVLGRGSPRFKDPSRRLVLPPLPPAQEIKKTEEEEAAAEAGAEKKKEIKK